MYTWNSSYSGLKLLRRGTVPRAANRGREGHVAYHVSVGRECSPDPRSVREEEGAHAQAHGTRAAGLDLHLVKPVDFVAITQALEFDATTRQAVLD